MQKVLLLCFVGIVLLFGNDVNLVHLDKKVNGWNAELIISPPVVVDKVAISNEQNSTDVDFTTDLDTSIYFLIDASIPMKKAFDRGIKPLLTEMERIKQPKEKWIVSYFDNDLHVVYSDAENNDGELENILKKVPIKGQRTELWRNTLVALKELSRQSAQRKILILLSDGNAEDTSAYTREDIVKAAQENNIRIVSLSYRDTIGTQNLRRISEDTYGAFWKANKTTHSLPSNFHRELAKFIRSEGRVTIPASIIHPTESGKADLLLTLYHGELNSTIKIPLPTETIIKKEEANTTKEEVLEEENITIEVNTTNEEAVAEMNATQIPEEKDTPRGFFEMYKLYLALLAALAALILLYLLLRKKPAKLDDAEGIEVPEADFSGNELNNGHTQINQTISNADPSTVTYAADDAQVAGSKTSSSPIGYFLAVDGTRYDFYKLPATIGKSSNNDIVISDKFISRHHATITHKNGYFYIIDNNSSNGIIIKGKIIVGEQKVSDGSSIGFGPFKVTFHISNQDISSNDRNDEKTRWIRS